jgi:hypothetical protein
VRRQDARSNINVGYHARVTWRRKRSPVVLSTGPFSSSLTAEKIETRLKELTGFSAQKLQSPRGERFIMEESDIGRYGELHIKLDLEANGFECHHDTKGPGSTDIEAKNKAGGMLVQVKAALHPNKPASLSSEECRAIVARAKTLGFVAWQAKVQINETGQLVGKEWQQLS